MAITATSAQYAACIAALRLCLQKGTNLTGPEKQLCLDCLLDGTQEIAGITDIAEDNFLDGRQA